MSDILPASDKSLRRFLVAVVVVALGFNLWSVTRYWNENLRDGHEFRQYQTAITAFFFQKDGLRLDYETPVLGPPWSVPLEFPLYQGIVAKLSSTVGLPLEQAGRLTSICAFLGCFPAVWLLLRRQLPHPDDGLVVLALALLCPVFLFYSRTFMIESTALCASIWFLLAFEGALERPRSWRLLAAWILGGLAAATKITTFAVICTPAIAMTAANAWQRHRPGVDWRRAAIRPLVVAAIIASVPLLIGGCWIGYSDHLKRLNPYGPVITSTSLHEFTFGTFPQRFTWKFWQVIGYHSFQHVITFPALLVMFLGLFVAAAPYRRLALVCLACYCAGFLTFANLYYVHDYYFYASAFFLVTAAGAIVAGLLRTTRVRPSIAMAMVVAVLASEALAFSQSYGGFYRRPNLPTPAIAEVIKAATKPEDVFAAFDLDWSSMIPYRAQRRAIMVIRSHTDDEEMFNRARTNLKPRTIAALLVAAPHRAFPSFLVRQLGELEMETTPIASSEEADLYVRWDEFFNVAARLRGREFPGVILHLPEKLTGWHDLTEGDWPARLSMTSPAPSASRGEFAIGIVDLDHTKAVSTQAPTEILVKPVTGAHHVQARCGVLPGAYQNGNSTDGVVLEIREERPDGSIRTLFRRSLLPRDLPEDRKEVVVDYVQDAPFQGTLVFGSYPGPAGNAAFDWVYWRSIDVH